MGKVKSIDSTPNIDLKKYPQRNPRCIWYKDKGRNSDKITLVYCRDGKKPHLLTLKDLKAKLWLNSNGKRDLSDIIKRLSYRYHLNAQSYHLNSQPYRLNSRPYHLNSGQREVMPKLRYLLNKGLLNLGESSINKKRVNHKNRRYLAIVHSILREFKSAKGLKKKDLDLSQYHINQIKDPRRQFTRIERTVSHTFYRPHPALGASYGKRFKQEIARKKPFFRGCRILEVGGGLGWLGRNFLDDLKRTDGDIYKSCKYVFLDLSNTLLKSQKRLNNIHREKTRFIQAHGEYLPFEDESFDYVIANEIIADFRVVRVDKESYLSKSRGPQREAQQLMQRYRISFDDAPRKFIFSVGALRFLEEAKRVLKKGGLGVIVEYGSGWSYPKTAPLKDHREQSIHFGHLSQVAECLGFKVKMTDLLEFLRFRKNVKVIQRCSLCLLRKLLKRRGQGLSSVFTPNMIKKQLGNDYKKFKNIRFVKVKEEVGAFNLRDFKVMLVRKAS